MLTEKPRTDSGINTTPPIMETDTQERLSARITGRVQGVGFRNFTQRRARRLGVSGWVRNENDGSVRLEAEGPRSALEDLLEAVHDGPRTAFVESVDAEWTDAVDEFDTFRVRR
jgi:acylphosphatase